MILRHRAISDKALHEYFLRKARCDRDDKKIAKAERAVNNFRPRRAEWGKAVFVDGKGKRLSFNSERRGFLVYVKKTGRKTFVRNFREKSVGFGKYSRYRLERYPVARKLRSIDIGNVKSKRARAKFLEVFKNPVARGRFVPSKVVSARRKAGNVFDLAKADLSGRIDTRRIDGGSIAVDELADKFYEFIQRKKSKIDYLVAVGISVTKPDGGKFWASTEIRFARRDSQKITLAEVHALFSKTVYAFLARELDAQGLVLAGSAKHIAALPVNKGKREKSWKRGDGDLWTGRGKERVTIDHAEYRIDHLTFGK